MSRRTDVKLPNDLERCQIFFLLKQWSSYTAWKRILGFYQAWSDAAERSLREACERGWEDKTALPQSDHVFILKGLAQFDEGVSRLRRGDKRVFRCDANGTFAEGTDANRPVRHWGKAFMYIESGDLYGGNPQTPLWDEFAAAFRDLSDAWGECGSSIIEPSYMGRPTHTVELPYGAWLQQNLPNMPFPKYLSPVPSPAEDILVQTGAHLPCSGIWEPVVIPQRSIVSLFTQPPPRGPFPIAGCMNYLHGGTSAPKAALETADDNPDEPATWRLLWRDDRYLDGTIPEEERSYEFVEPKKSEPVPSLGTADSNLRIQESGERAGTSGRWLLQDSAFVSITVTEGETLPKHEGRSVRWVLARA